MANIFLNISAALNKNLNDMVGKPSIAWENKNFTPVDGELYLLPMNQQGDTVAVTATQDETIGVYSIGIFSKAGEGNNESLVMADKLADQFKQDKVMTYGSQDVRVRNVSRTLFNTDSNGWLHMTVDVTYYAHSNRR